MLQSDAKTLARRGVILPLAAVLMVVLLGFIAFGVDVRIGISFAPTDLSLP